MAGAPDPSYDLLAVLDEFAPGVVAQRETLDAMAAQYAANGFKPLTQAQVLAIVGPLPAYPAALPRFPDSNESPRDGWVQYGPWLQGATA